MSLTVAAGRRLLRFCLVLSLASRSGIALTAEARQTSFRSRGQRLYSSGVETPADTDGGAFSPKPDEVENINAKSNAPLKVLFLSADTGGGHRASAESLAAQFLIHFPGSTYDLLDVWTLDGVLPYRTLVNSYKHLSANPWKWRLLYYMSNWRINEFGAYIHSDFMCQRKILRRIASYDPDVVVSVHPAMNFTPLRAVRKISKTLGKHVPFYTVCTDLGSAHCMWFRPDIDKMYVPSDRLFKRAMRRGGTPEEKIVLSGLPIRRDFAEQASKLNDRASPEGKAYQATVRKELDIDTERPMVLVMGGGEGVGGLATIVDQVYASLVKQGVDATVYVVCGRNEKLKRELSEKNWNDVIGKDNNRRKRRKSLFRRKRVQKDTDSVNQSSENVNVDVVGLGFVTRMAEYMVAADVLVTKAGPGTIAEAAAVGLPCMLTSFLPGQEAGNVDVVLEKGFGDYCSDPVLIGETVSSWLQDDELLKKMSSCARDAGRPNAAAEIVVDIGTTSNAWKVLNGEEKSMNSVQW